MIGYGVMFDGTGFLVSPNGPVSPILASAWTFLLVYLPALLACAGLSFLLIERPMLALREGTKYSANQKTFCKTK
jgi:hypothetical protein